MDISFCNGLNKSGICPKRDSCKRYVESLKEIKRPWLQSWTSAPFIIKLSGVSCDLFKSINEE